MTATSTADNDDGTTERFPSHSKYCGEWMPHTVAFCIDSWCLTQCIIFIWIFFLPSEWCVRFFRRLFRTSRIRKIWLGVNICCHLSHLLNGSILAHLKYASDMYKIKELYAVETDVHHSIKSRMEIKSNIPSEDTKRMDGEKKCLGTLVSLTTHYREHNKKMRGRRIIIAFGFESRGVVHSLKSLFAPSKMHYIIFDTCYVCERLYGQMELIFW